MAALFTGIVSSSNPGTYDCIVTQIDRQDISRQKRAVVASSVFAGIFGFKDSCFPQTGSKVLVIQPAGSSTWYIIGTIPEPDSAGINRYLRTETKTGVNNTNELGVFKDGKNPATLLNYNANRPTDVCAGEYVQSNELGVMLGLYQAMATLKASELAQVQCHFFDNIVRIVSHNFEQFHCMGGLKITHDGKRLALEAGFTDSLDESLGVPEVSEEATEPIHIKESHTADDKEDLYKTASELLPIERLKVWIGGLNNLLDIFACIPSEERQVYGETGTPSLGTLHASIRKDGGLHVRSLKEIFLEKTNWIRVPKRIRSAEDPEGDDTSTIEYEEKVTFTFDDGFLVSDSPNLYALQLQDYLEYVIQGLPYKDYEKHPKDFVVPAYFEDPASNIGDEQQVTPRETVTYLKVRSGIYLMPNGGITIRDAWGSAITMEGGDISISPAKDLVLQPLRNLIGLIGKFLALNVRSNIEINSTEGSIRSKAKLLHHFFSKESGIILQSDSEEQDSFSPDNLSVSEKFSGIALKAKNAIGFLAKNLGLYSKEKLLLRSDQNLNIQSVLETTCHSAGSTTVSAGGTLQVATDGALNCVAAGQAIFKGASSIFGNESENIAMTLEVIAPQNGGQCTISRQQWSGSGTTPTQPINNAARDITLPSLSSVASPDLLDSIKFLFLSTEDYGLSDEDYIQQSYAQQLSDVVAMSTPMIAWSETAIEGTFPFPGNIRTFYATAQITNIDGDLIPNVDSLSNSSTIVLSSIDIYKVIK